MASVRLLAWTLGGSEWSRVDEDGNVVARLFHSGAHPQDWSWSIRGVPRGGRGSLSEAQAAADEALFSLGYALCPLGAPLVDETNADTFRERLHKLEEDSKKNIRAWVNEALALSVGKDDETARADKLAFRLDEAQSLLVAERQRRAEWRSGAEACRKKLEDAEAQLKKQEETARTFPWMHPALSGVGWSLASCNHYRQAVVLGGDKVRHLFVTMTKDGRAITAEGPDERIVFEQLVKLAAASDAAAPLPSWTSWMKPGALCWYRAAEHRFAGVVSSVPRWLGMSWVVNLEDMEPAYGEWRGGARTSVAAVAVEYVEPRERPGTKETP